jgi:DNA mismatch repair ATPase MutL
LPAMAEDALRISLLPDDIRAKVSSSFEITTPEAVIEGLVRNALDADARSIVIDADFARGYLTVSDDGTGIREIEFLEQGQLAKSYCAELVRFPF